MDRIGQFAISIVNVVSYPALVRKVMSKCIVFKAGMLKSEEGDEFIHYLAECQDFELVEPGKPLPYYRVDVEPGALGYRVEFVKEALLTERMEKEVHEMLKGKDNGKAATAKNY